MRGTLWNPNRLKEPLAEGEAEITTWLHTPDGKPRDRVTLSFPDVPKHHLALYKGQVLYLTLEDGRQAKVAIQYVATLPKGMLTTLKVLSGWEEKLV
ncbi:MAG: hypothetical protein GXO55_10405 [Chloroflexi bacterium]|nr:hypothetical protein [Chloroflexota bacterium]